MTNPSDIASTYASAVGIPDASDYEAAVLLAADLLTLTACDEAGAVDAVALLAALAAVAAVLTDRTPRTDR